MNSSIRSRLSHISVGAALAAGIVCSAQAGTISIGNRNSSQTLSFADTAIFSDAAVSGTTVFNIAGNMGDTYSFGYLEPHGATGFSATASSDFSVTAPVFTSGIPNDTQSF